MQAANDEL